MRYRMFNVSLMIRDLCIGRWRRVPAAALLTLALAACGNGPAGHAGSPAEAADVPPAPPPAPPVEDLAATARTAIQEFSQSLQSTLAAALAEGGPLVAIDVCKVSAPAIAEAASAAHGLTLARTALRVRNPDNAPDPFERAVLERFADAAQAGAAVAALEHAVVVDDGPGGREFRFMKAIPMLEQPCGACHGARMAPEVLERLAQAYPDDAATGFLPGDLRGAFSVRMPLR